MVENNIEQNLEQSAGAQKPVEKMSRGYLPVSAGILLMLTLLARGMGYIYSIAATDVIYTDLTVSVFGLLTDVLVIARTAAGYGMILYAMGRWEGTGTYRCGGTVAGLVILMDAADSLSRFAVDMLTSSIVGREALALTWLLVQLCGSTVLVMLCWCTGRLLIRKGKSAVYAMAWSILYLLAGHLLLNGYYVAEFLMTYSDITRAETLSILGELLYTAVLYGGAAGGLGLLSLVLLGQWFRKSSVHTEVSRTSDGE